MDPHEFCTVQNVSIIIITKIKHEIVTLYVCYL